MLLVRKYQFSGPCEACHLLFLIIIMFATLAPHAWVCPIPMHRDPVHVGKPLEVTLEAEDAHAIAAADVISLAALLH